jgi:hypothetical protein
MPPHRPVLSLTLAGNAAGVSRRAGGNAARMVVGLPLRFREDEAQASPAQGRRQVQPGSATTMPAAVDQAAPPRSHSLNAAGVKEIARVIAAIVRQREIGRC